MNTVKKTPGRPRKHPILRPRTTDSDYSPNRRSSACDSYFEHELPSINVARVALGLPHQQVKQRVCLRCRQAFRSIEKRICHECTDAIDQMQVGALL